nr:PIN domain-containing protein [Candidatus Sigynarchaeota archaeon]
MKTYLDLCCYNRPFDDQDDDKIRLEAEAVKAIIKKAIKEDLIIVGSDVVEYEIDNINNLDRKDAVSLLCSTASESRGLNDEIVARARDIEKIGIDKLDALHIASAEKANADILFTVDDDLLKKYTNNRSKFHIQIFNPLSWMAGQP